MLQTLFGNSISKRLLIHLYNNLNNNRNYAEKLKREVDCTTSSINKNVKYLESIGILTKNPAEGKKKILKLTEKGKIIARELNKIEEILII